MNLRNGILIIFAAALAACATATPYQPVAEGYGYSEQQLESNRYRVRFTGNSETPREAVENYLMYRAAELTLQNGYGYFVVAARDTEGEPGRGSGTGFSIGFGSGGHGSGVGIGLGTVIGGGGERTLAQMDILVFKGSKPAADRNAFDAREVLNNLEPAIRRPAAAK